MSLGYKSPVEGNKDILGYEKSLLNYVLFTHHTELHPPLTKSCNSRARTHMGM